MRVARLALIVMVMITIMIMVVVMMVIIAIMIVIGAFGVSRGVIRITVITLVVVMTNL